MKLYALCVPNAMKGHKFTDDVAICRAWSKRQAIKRFRRLYGYSDKVMDNCVNRIHFNRHFKMAILTDY